MNGRNEGRHGSGGHPGIGLGALAKYARLVGQAPGGAVTHHGAAEWPWFD